MKAGLQQIPIQGAAPRLAGNREWDGLPMPTRFWAILAVAFGVSLSVIDGAIANVALPTMARMHLVGQFDLDRQCLSVSHRGFPALVFSIVRRDRLP